MEKSPIFENMEQPQRYRTIEHTVVETLPTGERVEEVLECNGREHRRCVDRITYSADGEITWAEQISREDLGSCDGNHS